MFFSGCLCSLMSLKMSYFYSSDARNLISSRGEFLVCLNGFPKDSLKSVFRARTIEWGDSCCLKEILVSFFLLE